MARRVLITGGSGFVGQWLSRQMLDAGARVFAGSIDGPPTRGVLSQAEREAISWLPLDVASVDAVRQAIGAAEPDHIVHLAGIAFPPQANADPVRTYDVNALGALRLLRALVEAGPSTVRVLMVGTSEQYGPHDASDYPISEDATLRPLTAYAGSKAAQEILSLQMARGSKLHVICTRSFNHSGPGHGPEYLLPSLVERALQLPATGGRLSLGNGTPVRDYLHVSDAVNAYVLLLERGLPCEIYNVCSGVGTSVRDLAQHVLDRRGISAAIVEDPALVRPSDVPVMIGDNRKLRRATGWAPQRSIDDIIDDLIHAATR